VRASLRVLRGRDFRLLFLGQSASTVGDQVVFVALALFVTRRTGSATDLGLVLGAQSATLVSLVLFGGVWADRLPRHQIMIACDLVRAALHATLAVLIFTGAVQIWQMVVLEAAFGIPRAFFQPAYSGLLPQTVDEHEIHHARALSQSSENVAALAGPALATALVLGAGAGYAFAFDAATFLISAVLLAPVRPRPRGPAAPSASVLHELRVGWREVASRSWVWATIAVYTGTVFFVYAFWNTLAPLVSRDAYHDTGLFGILVSVEGFGAVLGALLALKWKPAHPLRAGLLSALFWPLPAIVLALHGSLGLLLVTAIANGLGLSLMMIYWETALARHIPPQALSRVSSYDWMGSLALLPAGQIAAGPLAAQFGARTVLGVGAAIGFGLLCLTLIPRSARELEAEPAPAHAPCRPSQPSSSRATAV
jgi:MFS family permease